MHVALSVKSRNIHVRCCQPLCREIVWSVGVELGKRPSVFLVVFQAVFIVMGYGQFAEFVALLNTIKIIRGRHVSNFLPDVSIAERTNEFMRQIDVVIGKNSGNRSSWATRLASSTTRRRASS